MGMLDGKVAIVTGAGHGRQRWNAESVGAVIATDLFESRAPGLRPE